MPKIVKTPKNDPSNAKRARVKIEEDSPVLGDTERKKQEVFGIKGVIFLLQEQTVLLEQIKDLLEQNRDKK